MMKLFVNRNVIIYLLGIVVVTMPLKRNINSMAIILLLVYSLFFIYTKRKEVKFKYSKEVLILITPFLFILLQGFYSDWDSFSKNVVRSLPLIIFPLLFFYLKPWIKKKEVRIVLRTLVISAISYSLFLLIVAFYRQINYKPDFSTINWYFFTYYDYTEALHIHPTYLGMYLCLAFAVVFLSFLLNKGRVILKVLILVFLGVNVFLLGSRIALVSLMLIILILVFSKFRKTEIKKRILILSIIVATPILVFVFVPIVKERMVDMTFGLKESYQYAKYGDKGKDNNYNGGLAPRFQIWDCAVEVGNENYLFGNGFGTTQKLLNDCYLSKGLTDFSKQDYQTHSQYFNNYARGGLVGLFVLLFVYFYSMVYAIKNRNLLHFNFMVMIVVVSLTENILNLQLGIVFFCFFNSFFFFLDAKQD